MAAKDKGKKLRKRVPRRYRPIVDVLTDFRNWYLAAFVILAAGFLDYLVTGASVPYYQLSTSSGAQSLMETILLVIFVGLGVYFAILARRASRASSEGLAIAYAVASALLMVIWYVIALVVGGVIR